MKLQQARRDSRQCSWDAAVHCRAEREREGERERGREREGEREGGREREGGGERGGERESSEDIPSVGGLA